ncbi:hypothetical protein Bbelb_204560 [Branchiostoma belcheri]|nr:hypothetical protein Bbelb_204560 [Branchiostoma belcheri]
MDLCGPAAIHSNIAAICVVPNLAVQWPSGESARLAFGRSHDGTLKYDLSAPDRLLERPFDTDSLGNGIQSLFPAPLPLTRTHRAGEIYREMRGRERRTALIMYREGKMDELRAPQRRSGERLILGSNITERQKAAKCVIQAAAKTRGFRPAGDESNGACYNLEMVNGKLSAPISGALSADLMAVRMCICAHQARAGNKRAKFNHFILTCAPRRWAQAARTRQLGWENRRGAGVRPAGVTERDGSTDNRQRSDDALHAALVMLKLHAYPLHATSLMLYTPPY